MRNISWGRIFFYLFVIGVVVAVFALKGTQISSRQRAREMQNIQSQMAMQKIRDKERKEEETRELEKRLEEERRQNENNTEYQVKCWRETYQRLKAEFTGGMSTKMKYQHDQELKEAKENLLLWVDTRLEQLESQKEIAQLEGMYAEMDSLQTEIDRFSAIADEVTADNDGVN